MGEKKLPKAKEFKIKLNPLKFLKKNTTHNKPVTKGKKNSVTGLGGV